MKKRVLALFLSTIITAGVLSSCAPNEELVSKQSDSGAGKTSSEKSTEPVSLVFLRAGTDESGKKFWDYIIDEYKKEAPHVTIELQEAPWGNDLETKLNTAFASGTAPDVLAYNIASLGQRVPLKQYEPLDAYFETWEGKDDLLPAMKSIGMVGDTLYGLMYGPNPTVFCWRKDLFEKAGLDPNKPPKNWEELLDYHKKLTVLENGKTIQAGFSYPTTGANTYQFYQTLIMQNGILNFVDEATDELKFNSPEAIEAMQLIADLSKVGNVPYDFSNADNSPFLKGQSAMSYEGVANYNKAVANPDFGKNVGVTGTLTQKQPADFCGGNLFYITSQSKSKDEAWNFIEFNMRVPSLEKNFEMMGNPIVRESMKEKFIEQKPELNKAIFNAIEVGTGVAKVPYVWSMLNPIVTAMEKVILGEATPEDALQEAYDLSKAEIDSL